VRRLAAVPATVIASAERSNPALPSEDSLQDTRASAFPGSEPPRSEFLLELFSEEIPARMQARGAEDLARLVTEALAPLSPSHIEPFSGPRRIALIARINASVPESTVVERGPRLFGPETAVAGFLRKHAAVQEQLHQEGEFWVLHKTSPEQPATALIAERLPALLRRFPWPKSMRWGGTSGLTWVRPLKRVLCLLDGVVVPFRLAIGADDGHRLATSNLSEGHRMMAPGAFAVKNAADWRRKLAERFVVLDAGERRALIEQGLNEAAARERNLAILPDAGLLDEVTGLVEWPVALIGRIDDEFMDLPPEVMQVSMRVNQRYFATRDAFGGAAPFFAFVANIQAVDGGETIIAGNERVLRARFADARHFWDLDRKQRLETRLHALDRVTFHVELGSQGERVARLSRLAEYLAPKLGANPELARRAALLAKADLTTGMVGEFPELQGIMGSYYALHDGEPAEVTAAIRDHYAPKGPSDDVPAAPVSIAVALADKLDVLAQFFAIGEKPTGAGDPYALRRAGLGVIRIIRENKLRLPLRDAIGFALEGRHEFTADILDFLIERLRIQLRAEGARHDVLAAIGSDDDLTRLLARTEAVAAFLKTEDGGHLQATYKRAGNFLRTEEQRGANPSNITSTDGEGVVRDWFTHPEEHLLADALVACRNVPQLIADERFSEAMTQMARLRVPLDAFFDKVTVNDPDEAIRYHRLRLLNWVRSTINQMADFSRIEG